MVVGAQRAWTERHRNGEGEIDLEQPMPSEYGLEFIKLLSQNSPTVAELEQLLETGASRY